MSGRALSAAAPESFPRGALLAVAGLLVVAVGGTAAVRIARLAAPPAPVVAPAATSAVELRFADRADGSVAISDARTGVAIAALAPDSNGFVRGVMRGLARERMSRHIGAAPPFRLSRDGGGRLWLRDEATGRLIDLEAFGEVNRAAFAAFLPAADGRA